MKSRNRSTGSTNGSGLRRWGRQIALAATVAVMAAFLPAVDGIVVAQAAPATCARRLSRSPSTRTTSSPGTPSPNFTYIVNLDNTKLPSDPLALSTESNSPIVARGQTRTGPTVTLPDGRYLVSVRSLDHKMWGAYFTLPDDAANDRHRSPSAIELTEQSDAHPLPLGKIRVFVFNDNAWTNGAPGHRGGRAAAASRSVSRSRPATRSPSTTTTTRCAAASAAPTCDPATGFVRSRTWARRRTSSTSPARTGLQQRSRTANGTRPRRSTAACDLSAPTEEGADGTGAPGEQLWEPPNNRTAYWFGFVCAPAAVRRTRHRRDHRPGAQLGGVGAVHAPAPSTTRSRTRSSRCPTPRPTRPCSSVRATRTATSTSRTSRPATTTSRSGTSS